MKPNVASHGTKLAQRLSMVIIGIAVIFILYIGYLLFNPVKILEVQEPLPATPVEIAAGGTVNIHFDYCKYEEFESHIKVDFIGDFVIPTLSTIRKFDVGCGSEVLAIAIPAGTPEGVYTIRIEIDYRVNAIRTEEYSFESVEIKVLKEENTPSVDIGESVQHTEDMRRR